METTEKQMEDIKELVKIFLSYTTPERHKYPDFSDNQLDVIAEIAKKHQYSWNSLPCSPEGATKSEERNMNDYLKKIAKEAISRL